MLLRLALCGFSISVVGAVTVSAQDYPTKPIRVVTGGLGGGTNMVARLVAQGIAGPLGQQLIVDNRGGIIPSEIVAKAQPDGYTLLVIGQIHWISPLLQEVPYDPVKEFSPVTYTDRSPSLVVVHPALPVKSVKELVALAKAKPGGLNYAGGGTGGAGHLAGELFKSMAGVNLVWVPFTNMGAAVTELLSNQIQVAFSTPAAIMPHITAGKLRALAVATTQPSPLAPGLPTATSTGLPGFEAVSITAVFVPAKTPAAVINRLNQEIVRYINTPDAKTQLFNTGAEAVGSTPEELRAAMSSDISKYGKIAKAIAAKTN